MNTYEHSWSYLAEFFVEWEMLPEKKSCRENQNTPFMLKKLFSAENRVFYDNVETCGIVGQTTDDR